MIYKKNIVFALMFIENYGHKSTTRFHAAYIDERNHLCSHFKALDIIRFLPKIFVRCCKFSLRLSIRLIVL